MESAPDMSDPSRHTLADLVRRVLHLHDLDELATRITDPRRELRPTQDELTRLDEVFAASVHLTRRPSAVAAE